MKMRIIATLFSFSFLGLNALAQEVPTGDTPESLVQSCLIEEAELNSSPDTVSNCFDSEESYMSIAGNYYCKRVAFRKWVRCSHSTGQCFGPRFSSHAQCKNALP